MKALAPTVVLLGLAAPSLHAIGYVEEVLPIFREKCFQCHAESTDGEVKGNLAFDNLEDMEGFYIGKYTTMRPGDPENSLLLEYVTDPNSDDTMPPPGEGERLTPEEIKLVHDWLAAGAHINAEAAEAAKNVPISERPLLDWTNSEGVTIKARFVSVDETHVTILGENGDSNRYPLEKLDETSRKQAAELGSKSDS